MSGDLIADKVARTAGATKTDLVKGLAKAWLGVDQRATQSILASFNVSSITDIDVARTRASLSAQMASTAYVVTGATDFDVTTYTQFQAGSLLAGSALLVNSPDQSASYTDGIVRANFMGDLA